jgi:hypothetical protein
MNTLIAANSRLSSDGLTHSFALDRFQNLDPLTVAPRDVQHQLQQFLSSSTVAEQFENVFDITNLEEAQALIANGALHQFGWPQSRGLGDELINGLRGAYSSDRHHHLSQSLRNTDSLTGTAGVLLEEVGHPIDALLNPDGDTREIAIEPTNTLDEAQNLGTLVGTQVLTDFVGDTDTNDYYRFSLADTSNFRLSLSDLFADADVELLNSSGGFIQSSTNAGSNSESITRQLSAGTYYVRVYPYIGDTSYTLSLTATRPDAAGNTLSAARNVGALRGTVSFQDFVGDIDVNDYYRFSFTHTSNFRLALNGLSADADVELLNSSGGVIDSSTASGSTSESINRTLAAGTYYVRVYPYSGDTNYSLSLTATPPDAAGNTLSAARNIGTLRNTVSFQDFVGNTDPNDYYRFNVTTTSNFRLILNGLSADADVELLNSSGSVVDSSTAGGAASESINRTLRTGTYYVRVYPYSGETNYSLSLSAIPVVTAPDGAGNTLGTARNVGTLGPSRSFRDFVGSSDINDYYRFVLNQNSNFRLTLNGLTADADVQLMDRNGTVIQSSTASGSSSELITSVLGAGIYYVRVYPFSGNTYYNLGLSAIAAPIDRAGNSLATARNVGLLNGSRAFQDFVGRIDTNDYYRFRLSQTSTFRLALNGLSSDADVQLLNNSGGVIQGSYAEHSLPESINRTLNAGIYYVRVYPYSGNTNYNLSLFAAALTQPDGAGNTLSTARNVGTLNGGRLFRDFVGTSDTNDYYRFVLNRNSGFRLNLSRLTADADVQLLNSGGGLIQSSTASGANPETIERQLNAGTYYVRVYPFGNSNTNYELLLTATAAIAGFNPVYGYGLVNAAAAVARAIGQAPFADVANLGGNNWGNDLINAPEVWARGYTGQGVVVAVVDTGVDYTHADLNNNIWVNTREIPGNGIDDDRNGFIDDVRGWDFIGRDNNPMDEEGHGTHVAGTIAAENNSLGTLGVAYNARIMPVRVLGPRGGSSSSVASGIRYAVNNGARVINLSLGSDAPSTEIETAVRYATQRGAFVVMASGNDRTRQGDTQPDFPARYATSYGIAVGAIDNNRRSASFSNPAGSNSSLQYVVAPGVDIYSTTPGNRYGFLSGTSMATPHLAGVVALMLSANSSLTHAQIRSILTNSAIRLS